MIGVSVDDFACAVTWTSEIHAGSKFAACGNCPLGEVIWARPDLVTVPEVSFPAYVKRLRDIGIDRFALAETARRLPGVWGK